MRAVLPGKPQAKLQAVCVGQWADQRIIVYISGNAIVILAGPTQILQTIYHDDPRELEAVVVDEESGKIAACDQDSVHIYRPHGQEEGALRWSLQASQATDPHHRPITSLSWGSSEELLVGSSALQLYSTIESDQLIWTRKLANPVKYARFSYDAELIASTAFYDRLVKIWRRLSFGSDDVRFDFTYLSHPATVTGLHWRRPHQPDRTVDHVLYTLCADNVLRIWAATDPHGLQMLQLWAQVDLYESIQPRLSPSIKPSSRRYAFIIDSHDFIMATEQAVQNAGAKEKDHNPLDHLLEVAHRTPEVCVVLDRQGRMSAWGFENVGGKVRRKTNIFNVAHVEGLKLSFVQGPRPLENRVQFYNFCGAQSDSGFALLAHHFDGRIEWLETRVDQLFDPSPRASRLQSRALWSGHASPITKINRNASGRMILSRTTTDECLLWRQQDGNAGITLAKHSTFSVREHVSKACILKDGDLVAFIHRKTVSVWDTRKTIATRLASCAFEAEGTPLCLMVLPQSSTHPQLIHVATVTSKMEGIVWEICPPQSAQEEVSMNGDRGKVPLSQFCTFRIGEEEDLLFVLPVDPASSRPVASGVMDRFARDVAISCTKAGVLNMWTAQVDEEGPAIDWISTAQVETGIDDPSLVSATSIRKAAVVDQSRSRLTIWDTQGAQLEHEQRFEPYDAIQDLDWTSTPDKQSILAVGFPHRVLLLAQLRYNYLDAGAAWASIREVSIRELTPYPIGDSTWLGGGNMVIGAGNQLFVFDKEVDPQSEAVKALQPLSHRPISKDVFNVVARLNGPLPVFHPQFLSQCVLYGGIFMVEKVLVKLHKALRFFTDGDELDSFLGLSLEEFYARDQHEAAQKEAPVSSDGDDDEGLTEDVAGSLDESFAKISVPYLTSREQLQLANITECVALVKKHVNTMDENATRFLMFFRHHILKQAQSGIAPVAISWREITWAHHSQSQEVLLDLVTRQFKGRMLWENARESGVFMWMTDVSALRAQFEVIARNEYTKSDMKDPIDCSLYYMALKKKNVLVGLWRMAGWNREQRSTQRLLSNNFAEHRWKTAALKNAYALLGKHRFEYAAAFFLLADCPKDAVTVCINALGDLQLGIAVARVYEGDDGPVLKGVLKDLILPRAAREGNRWMASWAFWMLNRRDLAVGALLSPVHTLLDSAPSPGVQAKSFLSDDPALALLYRQLRDQTRSPLQSGSLVSARAEWEFVMQCARLYDRMGTDLGLPTAVVADVPTPGEATQEKAQRVKAAPTQFTEPEVSSLLDSFGF
ncbi:MAG: regulator of (H+)-ATPase in vacuolar membrane [Caeruleum heppii]|nr:MAG: regulator of (H+)-ATPase in vacuolar membrane [Caeruleum heppii]